MKLKNMIIDEYETAFPFEQEYNMWINSMEQDYRDECEYRAGVVVTDKVSFKYNTEEYSPYSTCNS